jgi:hypothetical protein
VALSALERTANKNAASGYAGLDASSKLAGAQLPYGTAANTACQGNDARLSDARPPTGHHATHERGGADRLLNVAVDDGTAAAPTLGFSTDAATGLYLPGASQLGLSVGGTARVTVTTTLATFTVPISANTVQSVTGGNDLVLNANGASRDVIVKMNGVEQWRFVGATGKLTFAGNGGLSRNTVDGSDNGYLNLNGGGGSDTTRGANINVIGNEFGGAPGYIQLQTGNVAGSRFEVYRNDLQKIIDATGADGLVALRFAATQVASSDVNTLDDYFERSFTPAFGGVGGQSGQVYASQSGRCVKVGKRADFWLTLSLSTLGTISGALRVTGLPYTAAAATHQPIVVGVFSALTTPVMWLLGQVIAGTTYIELYKITAAVTGPPAMVQGDLSNTTFIVISGHYETAN